MKGLRIVSRIYLTLAACASAVLWFFPWVQIQQSVAGGMNSLNSILQLFTADAKQGTAISNLLTHTAYSAFDLEKLSKSLLSIIHSADGTLLESLEDIETARQYLTGFRILLIALVCLAVFFGIRALTNHCLGYILLPLAQLASLGAVAVTAVTINQKLGSDVVEFSYFFYVLLIVATLSLFFWSFAQIAGIATYKKKMYLSNDEKRARTTVMIVSIILFFLCCGAGAALYFIV